jgi:hypothetical protein
VSNDTLDGGTISRFVSLGDGGDTSRMEVIAFMAIALSLGQNLRKKSRVAV